MSSNTAVRHYRFDRFELRPRDRCLLDDGKPVPIATRAFDVLVMLVERAGDLVSKEELLQTAWAGLVVEENNLQVQVSTLRKLLGPQTIATVPGRGYRLATPVSSAESGARAAAAASGPAKTEPPLSNDDASPIYGRDDDLLALRNMISAHALVTIVGPAGIGKTRVAEALARDVRDVFAEGVRVIEFAQLADPALLTVTVSRALRIAISDPDSALELTAQALAGQHVLLVLDNCEHLLDAVDRLVSDLRKHAPTVHVLVTSQELLRHPDEHVPRERVERHRSARAARRSNVGERAEGGRDRAVRRARPGSRAAFRADRCQRARGHRHLPSARWHPARARACGSAGALAWARRGA